MSSAVLDTFPQSLAEKIEQAVQVRTGGRIRGLQVRVSNSAIVISGQATSYYNKQLVTHAVMDACNDLLVTNEVEVA